jgi:fatty acid-binding protein DegV
MASPAQGDKQMDKDIKAKWLEALRSGRYRQGEGALRVDDKFCCLGVLPESLNSTLGIGEQDLELAEMNDSGKSFAEIADYIEQNL